MQQVLLTLLLVGVAFASPAWPQAPAGDPSTVGDLLARGGKRLTKEELVSLLSGATLSGKQVGRPDVTFENEMKGNGIVSGSARSARDLVSVTGTWSVNDQGILCTELRNNYGDRVGGCNVYFLLDASYFSSPAPAEDKAAQVYRRTVKR